jgi:pimeloyl-ACP methyl ester carboxylesterase
MQHHIIYVPGLADNGIRKHGQAWLISLWKKRYHVGTSYYNVNWANQGSSFAQKLDDLLQQIDTFTAQGKTVSLVASSAGATMAIHAFAKRTNALHKVVVVSGALGPASAIAQHLRRAYPAFQQASQQLPTALAGIPIKDKNRIMSVIPLSDLMVKLQYMRIPNAQHLTQRTHGHLWTIVASLLRPRFSRPIVDFIRQN